MKKKGERTVNKEEICEDWCFVCKDGGLLFVCDYKECLKAYHARCVGKDEQYFDSGNQLRCDWHSCLICHRNSKFHCFCCPNAVCKSCIIKAEFACVRGEKGFCNHCLKLALLSEENVDVDSDGQHRRLNLKEKKQQEYNYKSGGASNPPKLKEETANEKWKRNPQRKRRKNYYKNVTQFPLTTSTKNSLRREIIPKSQKRSHCQEKVDFRDRETYEGLFMEYWDIIKKQEGLTLEDLRLAHDQLKKGENFKSGSYVFESEEEDSQLRSDYEDEDTVEHKPVKKNKKSKGQQHTKKRKVSKKREFVGWGSKSLIDFLASIGKDASKELSQLQVSNIVTEYINENRLFNPEKKRMILCDEKLKAVLGRKTLKRNVIYDSLGPHFADNLETSEDEFDLKSSEDDDEILLVACKKQKLSICRKIHEKEEEFNPPQSCFASITSENIKLVYLRRSLVQELLKQPGTFEGKVLGSFVKVKSDFIDFTQKSSHQLLPVTEGNSGETKTEILLQVSNMSIDIGINMLSDDNFSEEECKDLRQKVKEGLLRRLTIVELEHKAKSLHEDITIHWINRELALLQNLIDRANEKGWRKELFEYMERKKLLQTPEEKSRLLETVPRVIADVEEVEPMSNDAIEESKPEDGKSTKFILMGSSETPGDNGGGRGFSSGTPGARGDRAVTNSNYDFGNCGFSSANGNGNARATQQNNIGSSIQVAGGNEQTGCASIPEAKQSLATRTCILEEQPCLIRSEEREKHSKVSVIADQPSIAEKRNQSKDLEQRSMRIQEAPAVQLIDLSSDDDDNDTDITIRKEKFVNQDNDDTDITIRKEKLEDQVTSLWHCLGPNEERRGPLALSLLKRWSETSSYALKFKVWKTGEREENAISLSDAVKLFSAEN